MSYALVMYIPVLPVEEPESHPISLARPIELDSGGKIKVGGAGKLVLIFFCY